jgi:mannose-6-phosphate isomerase-like protein (cupin superfamily)
MTRNTSAPPQYPGAVGLTWLRVYDSVAPDGVPGGSPHVHLASAEAYITVAGEGEVVTLGPDGLATEPLVTGGVVWFEPGIIHRLVNTSGDLEIFVVMQNAGLPEAGDAVLTFPDEILADPDAYRDAAGIAGEDRLAEAARRRDLAVEGFATMLDAGGEEREARYRRFLGRAVALRQDRVPEWRELWEARPLAEARLTGERLDALAGGSIAALIEARLASFTPADEAGYGMCGRLDTYLPEGWR